LIVGVDRFWEVAMGGNLLLTLSFYVVALSEVHAGQFRSGGRHGSLGWQGSNISWNSYGSSNGGVGADGGNAGGANDPTQYCRRYASTAINQAHEARETRSCSGVVSGSPSRWSLSYEDHYDRCLLLFGSGQNASEHRIRVAQLDQCFNR
jgi:hypothetical protein